MAEKQHPHVRKGRKIEEEGERMATQRKQRQTSAYIPPSHLAHEYNKAVEGSLEEGRRGEKWEKMKESRCEWHNNNNNNHNKNKNKNNALIQFTIYKSFSLLFLLSLSPGSFYLLLSALAPCLSFFSLPLYIYIYIQINMCLLTLFNLITHDI